MVTYDSYLIFFFAYLVIHISIIFFSISVTGIVYYYQRNKKCLSCKFSCIKVLIFNLFLSALNNYRFTRYPHASRSSASFMILY